MTALSVPKGTDAKAVQERLKGAIQDGARNSDLLLAASKALAASEARAEALEGAAEHALSDLAFVERVGPPGTNMQSAILHLRAALAAAAPPEPPQGVG